MTTPERPANLGRSRPEVRRPATDGADLARLLEQHQALAALLPGVEVDLGTDATRFAVHADDGDPMPWNGRVHLTGSPGEATVTLTPDDATSMPELTITLRLEGDGWDGSIVGGAVLTSTGSASDDDAWASAADGLTTRLVVNLSAPPMGDDRGFELPGADQADRRTAQPPREQEPADLLATGGRGRQVVLIAIVAACVAGFTYHAARLRARR